MITVPSQIIAVPEDLPVLRYGDSSEQVMALQHILMTQGYFKGIPKGNFRRLTQDAVRLFQMEHLDPEGQWLNPDGVVGPLTWWALYNPQGTPQRNWIDAKLPDGIPKYREDLLTTALIEHRANTHEIPDGTNWGDGVTKYLEGIGPAPWCFTGETEILTQEHGWVRFMDLTPEHGAVAQVHDDQSLDFAWPVAYIQKDYEGELYQGTQSKGPNFTCDSEHRFFGQNGARSDAPFVFRPIREITQNFAIPGASAVGVDADISDDELDFLGAFLADGYVKRPDAGQGRDHIKFNVSRPRKIRLLEQGFGGIRPASQGQAKTVESNSTLLKTRFRYEIPENFARWFTNYKRLDPAWLTSLSARQAKRLICAWQAFDGTQSSDPDAICIHTAREHHADALITLGTLAGAFPRYTYRTQPENSHSIGRILHCVRMHFGRGSQTLMADKIRSYTGRERLYCVQVPAGRIIVRGANRNPFVVGNCCYFASWCHKDATGEYIYHFNHGHVLTLWRTARDQYKQAHYVVRGYKPIPGDLFVMLYRNGGGELTGSGHIGWVLRTDKAETTKFNTIEGNAGNRVKQGLRSMAQGTLVGFINLFDDVGDFSWEQGVIGADSGGGDSTR